MFNTLKKYWVRITHWIVTIFVITFVIISFESNYISSSYDVQSEYYFEESFPDGSHDQSEMVKKKSTPSHKEKQQIIEQQKPRFYDDVLKGVETFTPLLLPVITFYISRRQNKKS